MDDDIGDVRFSWPGCVRERGMTQTGSGRSPTKLAANDLAFTGSDPSAFGSARASARRAGIHARQIERSPPSPAC